jgi:predicted nucleotidyltransferase
MLAAPRIGYACVFGSIARGTQHAHSDLDVAVGGLRTELGNLASTAGLTRNGVDETVAGRIRMARDCAVRR